LDETPDLDIWSYARQRDWVLVSKDDDFVHLANRPGDQGRLVWVRTGNCRKPALLESFAKALL
jgi:predicted nuclease of predicted toxin-antitoxin system